jgi:IS30 family transposase
VISRGLVEGLSQAEIGRRVGCSPSTISREVARNGGVREYRAVAAERATCERAKRPKQFKFAGNIDLADVGNLLVGAVVVTNTDQCEAAGRVP